MYDKKIVLLSGIIVILLAITIGGYLFLRAQLKLAVETGRMQQSQIEMLMKQNVTLMADRQKVGEAVYAVEVANFKADVSSLLPPVIMECDSRVLGNEFLTSLKNDTRLLMTESIDLVRQDCGPKSKYDFELYVTPQDFLACTATIIPSGVTFSGC